MRDIVTAIVTVVRPGDTRTSSPRRQVGEPKRSENLCEVPRKAMLDGPTSGIDAYVRVMQERHPFRGQLLAEFSEIGPENVEICMYQRVEAEGEIDRLFLHHLQ